MATQHLDLEEQEQLDQLKHFWNRWGNLITSAVLAVLLAFAGWNGWQFWQQRQGAQAAALYDQLLQAAQAGDVERTSRVLQDMQSGYPGAEYTAQAALLAAKTLAEKEKTAEARAALTWAAEKAADAGLQATARLRLAALLYADKAYDQALQQLSGNLPAAFVPLAADRKGDILLAQGKKDLAIAEYGKAYQGLAQDRSDYRRIVSINLTSLGIDPEKGNLK